MFTWRLQAEEAINHLLYLSYGYTIAAVQIHAYIHRFQPQEHVNGTLHFGDGDCAVVVAVASFLWSKAGSYSTTGSYGPGCIGSAAQDTGTTATCYRDLVPSIRC